MDKLYNSHIIPIIYFCEKITERQFIPKKMKHYLLLMLAFASTVMCAQTPGEDVFIHPESIGGARQEVRIPNVDGYLTLKGDFHMHTVFSDGAVWPTFRVEEARKTGLDIIAITDHIEVKRYSKWLSDKVDYNTSYQIAQESAQDDIIVVPGTEITRSKPFGHMNALFISDANKANTKKELDALEAMLKQGAYILWNHPGWPDDISTMYPIHKELIAKGKIHGVEIWNDLESYPVSYDWIQEYGLHPFANSDIHATIGFKYAGIRPMTLVFAKEKSLESIKEAMFAGRMLAFFNNFLMGKEEYMKLLVPECIDFEKLEDKGSYYRCRVKNNSDIKFMLQFGTTVHHVTVDPRSQVDVEVSKNQIITFVNCILAKNKYFSIQESELCNK